MWRVWKTNSISTKLTQNHLLSTTEILICESREQVACRRYTIIQVMWWKGHVTSHMTTIYRLISQQLRHYIKGQVLLYCDICHFCILYSNHHHLNTFFCTKKPWEIPVQLSQHILLKLECSIPQALSTHRRQEIKFIM